MRLDEVTAVPEGVLLERAGLAVALAAARMGARYGSRVIVLAFSAAMIRQIWSGGVAGWPDAALSIAVVLAIPILSALERVKPMDVLDVAKAMLGRWGIGESRPSSSVYDSRPSRWDDHSADEPRRAA